MSTRAKIRMSLAIVLLSGMVIGFFGGQMYIRWRVAIMTHRGPAALQEFMLGRNPRQFLRRKDRKWKSAPP